MKQIRTIHRWCSGRVYLHDHTFDDGVNLRHGTRKRVSLCGCGESKESVCSRAVPTTMPHKQERSEAITPTQELMLRVVGTGTEGDSCTFLYVRKTCVSNQAMTLDHSQIYRRVNQDNSQAG